VYVREVALYSRGDFPALSLYKIIISLLLFFFFSRGPTSFLFPNPSLRHPKPILIFFKGTYYLLIWPHLIFSMGAARKFFPVLSLYKIIKSVYSKCKSRSKPNTSPKYGKKTLFYVLSKHIFIEYSCIRLFFNQATGAVNIDQLTSTAFIFLCAKDQVWSSFSAILLVT